MRGPYPTHKPPTGLFCRYFYSRFHPHTSYNSTGCAIYSTRGRFCFHHCQNRKLHALPPPSAIKNDVIMCSWFSQVIQMLVIRGVPFLILIRPRVSVPLNSRPIAPLQKGRDHSPPKAFLEESSSFCFS